MSTNKDVHPIPLESTGLSFKFPIRIQRQKKEEWSVWSPWFGIERSMAETYIDKHDRPFDFIRRKIIIFKIKIPLPPLIKLG